MKIRAASDATPQVINDEKQIIRFKVSDETQDRYGDRISIKDWRFENYRGNPVLLIGHQYSDPKAPSVGKGVNIETHKDGVYIDYEFTPENVNPMGALMYRTYKGGYQRAVSVGFQPDEGKMVIPKDKDERESMGLGPYGVYYKGQDLLEVSLVTVPANPNALMASVEKGIIKAHEAEIIEKMYATFWEEMKAWDRARNSAKATCAEMDVLSKITSLENEFRSFSQKIEKQGNGGGRPVEASSASSNDDETKGADFWDKAFDQVETLAKSLTEMKTQ